MYTDGNEKKIFCKELTKFSRDSLHGFKEVAIIR